MRTIGPLLVPIDLTFVRIRTVSVLMGFWHVNVSNCTHMYAIRIPSLLERRNILFASTVIIT